MDLRRGAKSYSRGTKNYSHLLDMKMYMIFPIMIGYA
jgi:hypothetical protein